jgi:glycosyltransferase involved in cell wall biosynthesis
VYCPGRLSLVKRHALVLEALARCRSDVRVVFTGSVENEQFLQKLRETARHLGVIDKVEFRGYVDRRSQLELYADCLAVVYVPFDEDYGYVSLEAMLASKAVLTCSDSGGAAEFVEHDVTGRVCEPAPEVLAQALDQCRNDVATTRVWGRAGRERVLGLNLSWRTVVPRLIA